MNQAEKNNILDQHKKVYDGFVTSYGQQINQQPIYVQDFANDKEGFTVNNKGNIKGYSNMNINEANAMTSSKFIPDADLYTGTPDNGLESTGNYVSFDGKDRIGDSKTDMEHGTFDDEEVEYELELDVDTENLTEPEFEDFSVLGFQGDVEDE
jgi:hypothetical protein